MEGLAPNFTDLLSSFHRPKPSSTVRIAFKSGEVQAGLWNGDAPQLKIHEQAIRKDGYQNAVHWFGSSQCRLPRKTPAGDTPSDWLAIQESATRIFIFQSRRAHDSLNVGNLGMNVQLRETLNQPELRTAKDRKTSLTSLALGRGFQFGAADVDEDGRQNLDLSERRWGNHALEADREQ